MPPSINRLYRRNPNGYGMYKTAEAKLWLLECNKLIRQQGLKNVMKGKVDITAWFYFEREADLDNRLKSLLDCMQENLVIENDKQIYSINAIKGFDKKNPRVEIDIRENE